LSDPDHRNHFAVNEANNSIWYNVVQIINRPLRRICKINHNVGKILIFLVVVVQQLSVISRSQSIRQVLFLIVIL